MTDDMIGTLFESDATSLLDGEASHLLTELESMATDPAQPPGPIQQSQAYYDYGGGGMQQQMQSPQAIQSPAGSLHSPGGMISPSTPQHFNSPPPQQAASLQRQMSAPHQYQPYPSQPMQQGPTPQSAATGSNPMWRQPQPGYPHPSQSPQRPPPGYINTQQHAGGMVAPSHHVAGGAQSQQYMPHHMQPQPQPQHMSPQEMYQHMQQQHPQQQHPQQIQYHQQLPPGYMHPSQRMGTSQQHMMTGQPRMPRPGMPQYGSQMMHQARMSSSQGSMMRPPNVMVPPQQIMTGNEAAAMHQQQMQAYRQQHYQPMPHQPRGEMMPPGHYGQIKQPHAVGSHAGAPYGYGAQQPMMSPRASQPSYNMPQSSQHYQMATSVSTHQNGNSLEQLEKMVTPMSVSSISPQQYPNQSGMMPSSDSSLVSPRGQMAHTAHPQGPPNMSPVRPNPPQNIRPQHRPQQMGLPSGQQNSNVHIQQPVYGLSPSQSTMTPLETIGKEIEMYEHRVRQLQSMPPPYSNEQEKELRAVEERLRSLQSQQAMMIADVKQAQQKEIEKSDEKAASDSNKSINEQSEPAASAAETKPADTLTECSNAETSIGDDRQEPSQPTNSESDELSAALSAIVDGGEVKQSEPMIETTDSLNPSLLTAESAHMDIQSNTCTSLSSDTLPTTKTSSNSVSHPPPTKKEPKTKKSKSKKNSQQPPPQPASVPIGTPQATVQPPPHSVMTNPAMSSQPGMQPIAPHLSMQAQPIMFIQQQSGQMMHPQSMPSNMAGTPMTGQIVMAQPGPPNMGYQHSIPPGHPRMPIQQGIPRGMPPHPTNQLRAIAPRPNPQGMMNQMPPTSMTNQMNIQPNGPVLQNATMNTHLPELLEDPEMKDKPGFPDSVSDIPSTVDSPALSDVSFGTPGRGRKPGKLKNQNSKKGKKPGSKKPPASLLKLKKRKRKNSDSMSEAELSPGAAHTPDSQLDSLIVHRRSGRVTKRQKYVDELELDISDDEERKKGNDEQSSGIVMEQQNVQEETPVVNQYIVEKIMGARDGLRELLPDDQDTDDGTAKPDNKDETSDVNKQENKDDKEFEKIKVTEYFVKYKNFSYLHCEWRSQEELEATDKRVNQKIKRWQQKQAQTQSYMANLMDEDELFNPEYVEVDRVLAESHFPPPDGTDEPETVYFLIKWRQLPYEDATWELEQDVDKVAIEKYKQYVNPPVNIMYVHAPTPDQWKAIPHGILYKGSNQLREYQFEGVNWLTFCYYNRQNCILADEMGLGKTVQSITFLQAVFDYGIRGPFLVIAPLSTIGNWIREFDTWTDLNVIVYHGSSTSRTMLQEYEMFYKNETGERRTDVYKFHCLITTYEVIIQDVELLAQIDWRCCVIDEAHRLKNKNCKLMEGLRCFELEHKVLLSGTPLQNNVEELFSLLNFLEPNRFRSSSEFLAEFGDLKTEGQVDKLKAILKPMMLRRLKEDVEKNLAPKEETIIEVELTNIQKKYYRAILEKNFSFLSKGGTTANVPNLMNTMMELRKCCNHPYLIDGAEEQIILDLKDKRQSTESDLLIDAMVQGSGKLVLLDKLLPKLKAGNHKVLIFSQMIRVLDILEDYLINRKYFYERIDGRIRGNQRQEAIDRFSKPDSDRFVFLLCTRAGGLGINLTAADTCIIYDSDWNPQNDLQAQARCHRIGQQKAVKVYRLICRNTYEREMFDKASLKLGLDKAVLQSMGGNKQEQSTSNAGAPLSKQEVELLLKKGAYGALMEDDQAGDRFCEEDIDQILQRRTQIITIEAVGKGSTFAKASFSSSGARDDIDINDPEFWEKWAKKAEIEIKAGKNELIIAEPRRRKQTARYGGHQSTRLEEISDLESSSDSELDDKLKASKSGRRGRKKDVDFEIDDNAPPPGCYARPECFKVEKMLLIYGWGRWKDIVKHGRFRRVLDELDVTNISQAILLYSIQHYKGDITIKRFIWDLIMPSEDGQVKDIKNHQGLAAPTPRGRKPRVRNKRDMVDDEDSMDVATPGQLEGADSIEEKILTCPIDTESVLSDAGYRKHLVKHSNKVLLRVRMLYYLKQEIIGAESSRIFDSINWDKLDILPVPKCEGEPPATWWDKDSDKCLLIGVFKHGYEKYNLIRADSTLLFLSVCGPPDNQALRKEQLDDDEDADAITEDSPATPAADISSNTSQSDSTAKHLPFPSSSDLNTRLRRIITAYQKSSRRRQEAAAAAAERRSTRIERTGVLRTKDFERYEKKAKWTRREETDFYRVVSTFGVESNRRGPSDEPRQYLWDTFRQLANLHKKDDEMLTDYMEAFYYMCKKVCNRLTPQEEATAPVISVDSISEERATRCLTRIDLLNKIREEVLWHDQLTKRLTLCQFSPELPPWWKPGEHDKDLLIGAAKHGLAHTDQHILYDPKLCFKDLMLKSLTEPDKPRAKPLPVKDSHENSPQTMSSPTDIKQDSTTTVKPESTIPLKQESSVKSDSETQLLNGDVKHEEQTTLSPKSSPKPLSEQDASDVKVKEEQINPVKEEVTDSISSKQQVDGADTKSNGISASEEVNLPFYWPRDRVLYQRLELVCYCIETGEWPTAAVSKKISQLAATSHLDTPVGTPNPSRTATPNLSEYSCAMDDDEADSLKITISRGTVRSRKPKRSRLDLEVDRIARLRDGADSECSQSTPLRGTPDSFLNGSLAAGLNSDDFLNSFIRPRKKRGRKSKAEKEAETRAATEAAVAASYHRIVSLDIDSDIRIPMINIEDGSRLTGDDAPLRKDLQAWMVEHPGYMAEIPDNLGSSSSSSQGALAALASSSSGSSNSERRGRKSKASADSELPNLSTVTGAENVPVIHRDSGKRISGSKAPTLLQLSTWLDKNSHYDIDPVWGPLAKSILPDHLHNRVYSDKRKRKREAESLSASSLAAQQAATAQALFAASMQGYPMNLAAFNSLAALGMPASMMSMYGLGMGTDASGLDEETAKALAAAATSTHSAFPFQMYNPMLAYSSMLAAQGLGMSASQSYAQAIASAGLLNGMMGFDPTAFSSEMDSETAEKLAAMASSMASGMNVMEDLQMRSKMLEEVYGRSATNRNASSSATKEPGETSPSHSRSHHKKSATVTKPSSSESENPAEEEQPEDLTVKCKTEGDGASQTQSSEGRLSRASVNDPIEGIDRTSEGADERQSRLSEPMDGQDSSASNTLEGRQSRMSDNSHEEVKTDSPNVDEADTVSSTDKTDQLNNESVNNGDETIS